MVYCPQSRARGGGRSVIRRFFGQLFTRIRRLRWWGKLILAIIMLACIGIFAVAALFFYGQTQSDSNRYISRWFNDENSRPDLITIQREACGDAPFVLPSDGFIGLLWRDPAAPYTIFRRHSGIDIFGDGEPGEVPVYAAYDGYLWRLEDWVSSVIIQHDDPLQPGRTIWTYYTHMASRQGDSFIVADFPKNTAGVWVEQGTLLGYQGEYAGSSPIPVGMHLHFSIVLSETDDTFRNEADLDNTLDPSPYFGLELNIDDSPTRPIRCEES
jgi:murein DD-endopeptidase MepM/ murein hydrolase activator NlpD